MQQLPKGSSNTRTPASDPVTVHQIRHCDSVRDYAYKNAVLKVNHDEQTGEVWLGTFRNQRIPILTDDDVRKVGEAFDVIRKQRGIE